MRIVYIHQYFRTPRMSGGTRSYEFARRLVARGHQVTVITADAADLSSIRQGWRRSEEEGVEVLWARVPYNNSMPPWRRIAAFVHFLLVASSKASKIPQDVVFATSTPLTVAIPGAWSAYRNSVPMVLEIRDLWPSVPIALGMLRSWPARMAGHILEKWAYSRASRVVALSPDMASGVLSIRPDAIVDVIPNACDLELFGNRTDADAALQEKYPWVEHRPIILYAGAFGRVNGVQYLVEMAATLRHAMPEAAVVLVGAGAEYEATRERAASLGVLDANCFVLGMVPKEQVAAWFRACTLATSTVIDVPELAANSANKVFDALAAGRPVAINHGGWLAHELTAAGAGLVLPATDHEEAARQVAAFLRDEERVLRAQDNATRLARDSFDRSALADRLEAVLLSATWKPMRGDSMAS